MGLATVISDPPENSPAAKLPAPIGAELHLRTSEFYGHDVRFPLFCTRAGSIPGLRSRLTSAVPDVLAERSRGTWAPSSVLGRPVEHADGSCSGQRIDEAAIFKLPEKVYPYSAFTPTVRLGMDQSLEERPGDRQDRGRFA